MNDYKAWLTTPGGRVKTTVVEAETLTEAEHAVREFFVNDSLERIRCIGPTEEVSDAGE